MYLPSTSTFNYKGTDLDTILSGKLSSGALSGYALTSSLSSYVLTSSLSSYATTSSLSSYQPLLIANGNDTSSFKLLDTSTNTICALQAGSNITLSRVQNVVQISGPDLSSYLTSSSLSSTLTNYNPLLTGVGNDMNDYGYKLMNSNIIRSIKPGRNITISVNGGNNITIDGPDLSNYSTASYVTSALTPYATISSLVSNYVTHSSLSTNLSGYVSSQVYDQLTPQSYYQFIPYPNPNGVFKIGDLVLGAANSSNGNSVINTCNFQFTICSRNNVTDSFSTLNTCLLQIGVLTDYTNYLQQ